MKRNFLITNTRLKVFEWQGHTLLNTYEFKDNKEGHEQFEKFIHAAQIMPTQILLELIEEDFRVEVIPKLSRADRSGFVGRLIKRFYHDSHFVYHQKIRTLKNDRKEEEILLTAITNNESIDDWIEIINRLKVPISGIWSLPLLCEELSKKLFSSKSNVLLITRQMLSSFRETFMRQGKLIMSRKIRITSEDIEHDSSESYMDHNVDKIKKFLTNKQYLNFKEDLHIICLMPDGFIEQAEINYKDSEEFKFHFFGLNTVKKKLGIVSPEIIHADAIFSFLCASHPARENPYGNKGDREHYFKFKINQIIRKWTYYGSIVLFAMSVAMLGVINSLNSKTTQVKAQKNALLNVYDARYSAFQEQIDESYRVKNYVDFSVNLENESGNSFEYIFSELSPILSKPVFQSIKLTYMDWEKLHSLALIQALQNMDKALASDHAELNTEINNYDDVIGIHPIVSLKGLIIDKNLSYREQVTLMNRFKIELLENAHVQKVWILKMPVDVRENSRFTDQTGSDENLIYQANDANRFELKLLLNSASETTFEVN